MVIPQIRTPLFTSLNAVHGIFEIRTEFWRHVNVEAAVGCIAAVIVGGVEDHVVSPGEDLAWLQIMLDLGQTNVVSECGRGPSDVDFLNE